MEKFLRNCSKLFKKYKDTFGCVEKIADFLTGAFDYQMSTDEKMYLTIHTARLVHENRCK